MKKQLFSFLILISLFVGVSAQGAKQSAAKPDLTEQNLRKHVAYLASDKLEGRRTGGRGATFAAGYVAGMFSNFKLKSGLAQNKSSQSKSGFMQSFPFVTGIETAKTGNEFRIEVANSTGQPFQTDNLAAWKALAFSPNADIAETPIVFAGYGIQSNELKTDDYAGLDVKNKIVLAFDGNRESANPHSNFTRFDARAKAKIAKDKGAKALFIISRLTRIEDDRLASMKYDATLGEAALPVVVVSRRAAAAILGADEAGLNRTESFVQTRNEKDLAELQTNLQNNLKSRAAFKINLVKKDAEAYNVVGVLEGIDPILKSEAIVIGAHYDHLGRGGQGSLAANSTEIHHGADDNASGVAALLELARRFSSERKNKRTIIFIAFGGEEEGLLGSKFYVENPAFPLAKTVAMINLDMVGRLKENKLTIGGIGTAGEWKSLVEKINAENYYKVDSPVGEENLQARTLIEDALRREGILNVFVEAQSTEITLKGVVGKNRLADAVRIAHEVGKRKVINQLTEGTDKYLTVAEIPKKQFQFSLNEDGFGPSDHSSFYGKQIPVLFFFTGTHAEYHKPTDTADKINYAGLYQITDYVGEIVKSVDGNQKRPAYAVAKSSGMMGGRTGFNVSLGTIPSYAESNDGLVLDGVRDDSPASKAGLKAGDKITKLAGREVRNISDYTFVLGEMKADTEYEIVIKRGSENLTLKIIPAARK